MQPVEQGLAIYIVKTMDVFIGQHMWLKQPLQGKGIRGKSYEHVAFFWEPNYSSGCVVGLQLSSECARRNLSEANWSTALRSNLLTVKGSLYWL